MKSATYYRPDGKRVTVSFDPDAPCRHCGLPICAVGVGRTDVCWWCVAGECRYCHERPGRYSRMRCHLVAEHKEQVYAVAIDG